MSPFFAIKLSAAAIISFLVASYLGPLLMAVAIKLNVIDTPDNKLKTHKAPTPYLGGLVIYGGMVISLILFFPLKNASVFFMLGSTLLLLIGLIDDILPLKPQQKFFGQVISTICFIKGGFYLKEAFFSAQHNPMLYGFWIVISAFWMLSIINAFNLVDVMDGLASVIAFMASLSFFVIAILVKADPAAVLLVSFMGALAGFLRYNLPPAQMYLGDSGSLFIGGVMAVIPFMIPWGTFSWYGYLAPPIILGLVSIEILTLIVVRKVKKIPFYAGSPHHFCHFLKSHGWSTHSILLYVIAVSLCLFAISVLYLAGILSIMSLSATLVAGVVFWYYLLFFGKKLSALERLRLLFFT